MHLDPDSSLPPYRQLAAMLAAAIKSGEYPPGAALPSGPELAAEVGVSRATVQSALKLLKSSGLIVSRQGSGTFVREQRGAKLGGRHASSYNLPVHLCFYALDIQSIDRRIASMSDLLGHAPQIWVQAILPGAPGGPNGLRHQRASVKPDERDSDPEVREAAFIAAALRATGAKRGSAEVITARTLPGIEFEFSYADEASFDSALRDLNHSSADPSIVDELSLEAEWFNQEWSVLKAAATDARVPVLDVVEPV